MKECCKEYVFANGECYFKYCPICGCRLDLNAKHILEELNLQWQPRICVDFDACICESHYPDTGSPNLPLIQLMKDFKELGCSICLNTCRHDESLDLAVEWCKSYGLEFDFVNENDPIMIERFGETRKLSGDLYIDDKAMKIRV